MNANIVEAIKNDKLILFVGAGLSTPLGFPNWNDLVIQVLNELVNEDKRYQILKDGLEQKMFQTLEVLDKIKHRRKEVYEVLDREIDRSLDGLNLELHKKLGKISSKIITTNYDKVLENATRFKKVVFDNTFHIASLLEKDNYLLKLHGCIENPEKCIFFQDDYDLLYTDTAAIERLKGLISDYTILFIGFSLSDEYVKKQFEYINKLYGRFSKNHYIITTNNSFEETDGVRPIKISDWDQLDLYLDQLIEIKENLDQTSISTELIIEETKVIKKVDFRIAILISTPIDKDNTVTFEKILKNFSKYNVIIECFNFSIETIRSLVDFDFIFAFSNTIKNKIIIEDQYFKSKLITLQEIDDNLIAEHLKGFFLFIDNEFDLQNQKLSFPLALIKGEDLSGLIFKFFHKKTLKVSNIVTIFNEERFNFVSLEIGNPQIIVLKERSKARLSESIDAKNLSNFVGRKTDIEDIIRKVLNNNNSILTIKGSGGIGKTSIIKKVSLEFFERGYYSDGIFFIDCEFINNYQSFEYKIGHCFGIDSSINIKEHILQNNMKLDVIIILDNFEPLLYIEDIEKIKGLLTFICEYSNIIITSREWIDFEFEERHELRGFTNEEALQLFNKCYKSIIKESEMKILKEEILDKLLNNNPLAIKVITRNIPKTKSMFLLKDELEADFFSITEVGYEDIFDDKADANIERSKSLYQSISYSYKRLSPNEKLLFEILSIFPDGIHMNNIKTFFQQDSYKWHSVRITDREINSLENKSLIEINRGFIKLQSIIGRFAEKQFLKRTNEEKIEYYKKAYDFIVFVIEKVVSIYYENEGIGIRVFDQNIENCLKCLDYIVLFDEDKIEKLQLIGRLNSLFKKVGQASIFHRKIRAIKKYFYDIENSDIMLESIIINSKYYDGEFEEAYVELQNLVPIEKLYSFDNDDMVQGIIIFSAINVYKYRDLREIRKYIIESKIIDNDLINDLVFHAGEYKKLIKDEGINHFYRFEAQYNTRVLNVDTLKNYVNSLYQKQYIDLMQNNYILAKLGILDRKTINNLVVTNPYTSGLKSLMLAFIEKNYDKAIDYYESAIRDLQPIRYYCTEAIYFYAKFLRSEFSEESSIWIKRGITLARESHYRYLEHRFHCLVNGVDEEYIETTNELPDELNIDELIKEYNMSK
ncbi:SIR2 family protein [Paenibacillus glycanilyticus]|uniref:SIR2 family protein n=1 Tax=Paenibacillus glycanilyticus TaxID=126569 RepID=UPI000FDC10D8|nr:SIR2 family protein [Paenibacillus glycanilyticus]